MDSPENRAASTAAETIRDLEGTRDGLEAEIRRLKSALRSVRAHHEGINDAAGRPRTNSTTLRIVTAALAGCDHLAGDVCRRCHPSLPVCARHPEAAVRRFGPLWRCGECGEEATLLLNASRGSGSGASPNHGGPDHG